jgi:hypothetical protein
MKKAIFLFTITAAVGLLSGGAFAFTCPVLIKAANESIAKAESAAAKITGDREKGRAMAMIELAKDLSKRAAADHKEAVDKKSAEAHYRGEAKAKAAQALVDQVK